MPSSCTRGQASAEYVAAVAIVALVLGAVTTVGAPWLPGLVVEKFKLALCVVGLDVCTSAQARAEGLRPCVTRTEDRTRGTTLLIAAVDTGGTDRLVVEARSDGSYLVTASHETRLGASAGAGVDVAGLVRVEAGVSGGGGFGSGTTLEVADAAALGWLLGDAARDPGAARKLVREIEDEYPAARVTRYRQLGARAGATASAGLGRSAPKLAASGNPAAAVGLRTRAGVRTYYYDVRATAGGPLAALLPATDGRLAAAWEDASPPVLTVTAGSGSDRLERLTEARMVLATAEDRRLARDWLLSGGSLADASGRGLAARMRDTAVVQRLTYAQETVDEGTRGLKGRLGVGLGYTHLASVTRRRLVDAQLLDRPAGGRRLDCLPPAGRD